jgi:hypothetical protein
LKRRLKPALEELEQLGFLEPLSSEERYSYIARGQWRIILIRARQAQAGPAPAEEVPLLVEALSSRGVTSKVAAELVGSHSAGRIQTKLEVFDWLVRNQDKRVGKNPAGYLVASIRADYQAPGDFKPGAAAAAARTVAARRAAEEAERRRKRQERDEAVQAKAREAELRARWERLPEAERDAILGKIKAENPGLSRWKKMLEPLCLSELERRLGTSAATSSQGSLFDPNPSA